MEELAYFDEYPSPVTVCDTDGIILYINKKAAKDFTKWGGLDLIGKNLYDCHKPSSNEKIKEIIATGLANTYTIEKNGVKKLIHQAPWYKNGTISGLIEISIILPNDMPSFNR